MKILLFDIDGTLLLTGGAGRIAFERVFEELFGVSNAWGDLRPDGKTDPAIIEELAESALGRKLEEKEYKQVCELYSKYFEMELERIEKFRLMPQAYELIEKLHGNSGFVLGIATGNFEEPAWQKLERANLRKFFRFGGFGSDSHDRFLLTRKAAERGRAFLRPGAALSQIFVIGDTVLDIKVGRRLGALSVGVATGRTTQTELEKAGADLVLKDFTDPTPFFEALGL